MEKLWLYDAILCGVVKVETKNGDTIFTYQPGCALPDVDIDTHHVLEQEARAYA